MSYLAEQIGGVLALDSDRPAIFFKDTIATWSDLRRLAQGLEAKLSDLGVPQAAGVGCLLRNRPPHFAAILGVIIGERCVTTLNPVMPDKKVADDIRNLKPPVVVAGAEDWARDEIRQAAQEVGAAGILLREDGSFEVEMVPGMETVGPGPHLEPMPGIAVLMLTSGTTGAPKRAPLTYKQLELNLKRSARADRTRSEDEPPRLRDGVALLFTPFVHIGGLYFVLTTAADGRATRLLEKFSVDEWRKAIAETRPQTAGGPPTVLKMIYDANIPKEEFSSLVAFSSGTAAVSPDLVDKFMERYGLPVLATYGATEFAGAIAGWSLATFNKYWKTKRGAAGRMHPGIEARAVDRETFEPLPPGEVGLLELKGPVLGDGQTWLRTADLAIVDEDHFLFIKGRADNAIIRGGFKVMPDEVVKAMETHPAISEASVVGLPDERLGAVPAAAFMTRPGHAIPDAAELSAYLRERLTPYQVPVKFLAVDELPRTPSMKVSMPAVKALFEEAASA